MSNSYKRDPLIFGLGFYDPNLERPDLPAEIELLWKQYAASGDVECLARAAEIVPFFGRPEIGKAIAEILRDKEPSHKLEKELAWREIDLLYKTFVKNRTRKIINMNFWQVTKAFAQLCHRLLSYMTSVCFRN